MHWSAEEFALGITGLLFLVVVASSFLPRVELTPVMQAAFAIGAAAFIGCAALSARTEGVSHAVVAWMIPAAVLIGLAAVVRDGLRTWRTRHVGARVPAGLHGRMGPAPSRTPAYGDGSRAAESPASRALRQRAASPRASAQELAQLAYRHPHLRAVVAANPAAPANLLAWLDSHGDPEIRAAIANRRQRADEHTH